MLAFSGFLIIVAVCFEQSQHVDAIKCYNATHAVPSFLTNELPSDAYIVEDCKCCMRDVRKDEKGVVVFRWGCAPTYRLKKSGDPCIPEPPKQVSQPQSVDQQKPQIQTQTPATQNSNQQTDNNKGSDSPLDGQMESCRCCSDLCNKQRTCEMSPTSSSSPSTFRQKPAVGY